MGIPSYYKYITNHYNNLIKKEVKNPTRLFLDLNGCIHPCSQKIVKENPHLDLKQLTKKINEEVLHYIHNLLDYCCPSKLLFIAMDGTAPRAKMQQQRFRRYKASKEKKDLQDLYKKHNKKLEESIWDSNSITPGTEFMFQLSIYLEEELKKIENIKEIILSDSNVIGEGEHKIFDYIRNNTLDKCKDIIYGLDADLIMLSMSIKNGTLFLLRESLEFDSVTEVGDSSFLYLDIHNLKKAIMNQITLEGLKVKDEYRFICDYICMCFLLGNDFLPPILSLGIKNGGINILLEYYLELNNNTYLVEFEEGKVLLNIDYFKKLIDKLSNVENDILMVFQKNIMKSKYHSKVYTSNLERDIHKASMKPLFDREKEKYINFGYSEWSKRYYETCFLVKSQEEIKKICVNYLEGIIWTLKYYFEGCSDYHWYYIYIHPPCLKDIKLYLEIQDMNLNDFITEKNDSFLPFEQLLFVLPSSSYKLLPLSYQPLMYDLDSYLLDYYPSSVQLDMVGKFMTWQCVPILPCIDKDIVLKYIEHIKLSKEEEKRNIKKNNILITGKI